MEISETSNDYSDSLSILDQSILITTAIQVISFLLSSVFYVDSENDYLPLWEYIASMW